VTGVAKEFCTQARYRPEAFWQT